MALVSLAFLGLQGDLLPLASLLLVHMYNLAGDVRGIFGPQCNPRSAVLDNRMLVRTMHSICKTSVPLPLMQRQDSSPCYSTRAWSRFFGLSRCPMFSQKIVERLPLVQKLSYMSGSVQIDVGSTKSRCPRSAGGNMHK